MLVTSNRSSVRYAIAAAIECGVGVSGAAIVALQEWSMIAPPRVRFDGNFARRSVVRSGVRRSVAWCVVEDSAAAVRPAILHRSPDPLAVATGSRASALRAFGAAPGFVAVAGPLAPGQHAPDRARSHGWRARPPAELGAAARGRGSRDRAGSARVPWRVLRQGCTGGQESIVNYRGLRVW